MEAGTPVARTVAGESQLHHMYHIVSRDKRRGGGGGGQGEERQRRGRLRGEEDMELNPCTNLFILTSHTATVLQ